MKQYIDKAVLVAEFNRLISELIEEGEGTMFEQGRISAFEDAKLFLDTLEVKKGVSLNKACDWIKQHIEDEKYRTKDEESYRLGQPYDYFETNMFIADFRKAMINEKKS